MAYITDLTEPQFELLEEVLPKSKTYKNVVSRHLMVNAIFYQLKNGCQWRDLPTNFPKLANRLFTESKVEVGRNVGKSVGTIGTQ